MANAGRRRNRTGKARRARRGRLSHPGVWLATLSTVVGIATGMFTLRDQVLPQESGSAQAALADYQTSVGGICLLLNEGESARARDARDLARRLPRARSIPAQRDLLLDSTNRRIAQLVDEISKLSALAPPKGQAAEHRRIRAAWERNLERIRDYAHHLDGAGNRAQLVAALDVLYRDRVPLSRDGLSVRTGLSHLGGRHCHLDKPIVTRNVTVPRVPGRGGDGGGSKDPPASSPSSAGGGSANPPGGSGSGSAIPPDGSVSGSGSAIPPAGSGGGSATPPDAAPPDAVPDGSTPPAGSGDGSATPPVSGGGGTAD